MSTNANSDSQGSTMHNDDSEDSHYRAKQAGAREVRLLEGHAVSLRAHVADIGLVRDKLLHHQRINAAQNNEDTPEHKAQREGDATALETCEALLDKPTRDLANLTREIDEARAYLYKICKNN